MINSPTNHGEGLITGKQRGTRNQGHRLLSSIDEVWVLLSTVRVRTLRKKKNGKLTAISSTTKRN